jgi:hypothetical protein
MIGIPDGREEKGSPNCMSRDRNYDNGDFRGGLLID